MQGGKHAYICYESKLKSIRYTTECLLSQTNIIRRAGSRKKRCKRCLCASPARDRILLLEEGEREHRGSYASYFELPIFFPGDSIVTCIQRRSHARLNRKLAFLCARHLSDMSGFSKAVPVVCVMAVNVVPTTHHHSDPPTNRDLCPTV